jgi:hypothetical protein
MQQVHLAITTIGRSCYRVAGYYPDGSRKVLGRVERKWFRHLNQYGWEATGEDGSHRAVHRFRWQALWALLWDGQGYPFPVTQQQRRAAGL